MVIDGHAHACGDFLKLDNIIRELDRNHVDKVVLVPGELQSEKTYHLPNFAQWFPKRDVVSLTNALTKIMIRLTGAAKQIPGGNEYVAACARQAPERIIQFYWAQLSRSQILAEIQQRFYEWGFRGLKLHQCWESFSVRSEKFHCLAEWAGTNGLPIFFHLGSKTETLALIEYIKTHAQPTFIIGHLFGLEEYIKADLQQENVYFEISTPPLISIRRLEKAIACFGAQKIVFGSDTPYGKESLQENIRRVKALALSDHEKHLILGGNTQKLLHLDNLLT